MLTSLLLLGALPAGVFATDVLKTDGFSTCSNNTDIQVTKMNMEYNRGSGQVTFDVEGTSAVEQDVTAAIVVTAYGKEVYRKDFDPCDSGIRPLCPLPKGHFAAQGNQSIDKEYADQIPGIAFNVPDLDGIARLELKSKNGNQTLACIQSTVNNGKSMNVPAVSYVAAGIAGAALALSLLSAAASGGHTGSSTPSPTFTEVMWWFQGMAMNGMLSVEYPAVYRSFSKNFAFSTGLVPWDAMQTSIDNFRAKTGGNLTEDSVAYLRNATLIHTDGNNNLAKRSLETLILYARDISTTVNGTTYGDGDNSANDDSDDSENKFMHTVHGIQGYVEELTIPQANTFMTVLLIFAIVIAAICVGILLFKVILETWALFGSFPKRLTSFRKRYWWLLAKTITSLILLLYGIWTLYCVYQFTSGDSWAAKVLAGVTLGLFTAILLLFTWRIWSKARQFKKMEGDASMLYEDKKVWVKYSLFYGEYKKNYWWLFVPAIIYMFAKGCVIAGGEGHGMVQTAGQLIIESLLLILLLWSRPYSLKSGNWINIFIQIVRVLSVVCILVFVEELGVSQTTKTITGVVLIVMQSVLTGVLAILIAVNSIIICCKTNPHRKRRKEQEKANRDLDNLTPLDARNSLLMEPFPNQKKRPSSFSNSDPAIASKGAYDPVPLAERGRLGPRDPLLDDAASMGGQSHHTHQRSMSPPSSMDRHPTLPDIDTSYHSGRGY
ncbi:DUF907 domain protein [Aulographum hederae CBS 113979]|uniref:DUF907 domain protein n=1 Tax=Aulographum hederae CBS 113979 TaxID=1176131 RepID=A0A6G1GX31_9PEZI|nr:DUF907 domain protein [Aulographum hederae CBS 113979]